MTAFNAEVAKWTVDGRTCPLKDNMSERITKVDAIIAQCRLSAFEGLLVRALKQSNADSRKNGVEKAWKDFADVPKSSVLKALTASALTLSPSLKMTAEHEVAISGK